MRLDSISQLYSIYQQYQLISTDSRNCPEGSLFFALKGDNFNANAFACTALEQGAEYAVIDEEKYAIDDRFIIVDNVLKALQNLATFHRRQLGTPIISITGTNGKTTTKELIASVLKEKYNILYTQGNLNNHIGVPLTLLNLKPEHELAIIEMGASHSGEIKTLCEITRPDYGLVTNVGKAHLEGFGSLEEIKKTKAELYDYIAKNGKLIFINKNNDSLVEMAEKAGIKNKTCGYIPGNILKASPFLQMECNTNRGTFNIHTNLIGSYNAENILASVTIGNYFLLSNDEIKQGLENYFPQNNRSQFIETKHNKLIVDTYNANPTSMGLAIKNFAEIEAENKMLILGDMLELGEESAQEHKIILDLLQSNNFKNVLLVGKEFSKVGSSYTVFETVDKLNDYLSDKSLSGFYILIKGSRGIKLEKSIEKL